MRTATDLGTFSHVPKIGFFRLSIEIFAVVFVIIYAVVKKYLAILIPALSRPKLDFQDKVVLLTGAGGGFGRRLAERLARRGAIIACVDVDNNANQRCVDAANDAAKDVGRCSKPPAHAFRANLASREETHKIVQEVERKFGRIDVLISGAVCFTSYDVMGFQDDEIDFLIDLNFKSTVWLVRAVLPSMRKQGFGQIAVMSSLAGLTPAASLTLYSACKSAMKGFMMSLREELRIAPEDIDVTVFYPFFSPTSPILREITTHRLPNLDPDDAADDIIKALEDREVQVVLPRYMGALAGIHGLIPQDAVDYLSDVADVRLCPNVIPKATITVDNWINLDAKRGPSGALVLPHDGDEDTVIRRLNASSKTT